VARSGRQVGVQHLGQQPDRPAPDAQVEIGVAQADITGLVQRGLVVAGQPGQADSGELVVTLVDGEQQTEVKRIPVVGEGLSVAPYAM
jgi:hypothetical protein